MITLLVAPDSPQWTRTGRCRRWRHRAVAVGTANGVQGAIRAQRRRLRQGIYREVQCSAELRIGRRLRLRLDSATGHRASRRNRHGQSARHSMRRTSRRSTGEPSFQRAPASTASRWATPWSWRSGRRTSRVSWSSRWSGRWRPRAPTWCIRSARRDAKYRSTAHRCHFERCEG